jgi:hypothetical protein
MQVVIHDRKSADVQGEDSRQFRQPFFNPLFALGILVPTQKSASHTSRDAMIKRSHLGIHQSLTSGRHLLPHRPRKSQVHPPNLCVFCNSTKTFSRNICLSFKVSFTFEILNFDNDIVRPNWDNKGKEITQGIDDNKEPTSCTKAGIAW